MKTTVHYPVLLIFAGLLLSGCTATQPVNVTTGQSSQSFEQTITKSFEGDFLVYIPDGYSDDSSPWPLILFLHGAGERGNDLELVKKHGPPKLVDADQAFPFVIVSPQVKPNSWWDSAYLMALLDEVEATYNIDSDRIYLTGLSMGGFGTWDLAMRAPERFAAIAPICGGGFRWTACSLKNTPVWAFHGAKDQVVPLSESEQMVEAVNACDGNAKLTIYPDANHDSWTETYDNQELYTWFLKHSRQKVNGEK